MNTTTQTEREALIRRIDAYLRGESKETTAIIKDARAQLAAKPAEVPKDEPELPPSKLLFDNQRQQWVPTYSHAAMVTYARQYAQWQASRGVVPEAAEQGKPEVIKLAKLAGFVVGHPHADVLVKHSNGSWVDVTERLVLFAGLLSARNTPPAPAMLTAAPAVPAVPDGWKLVPVVPTPDMIRAAQAVPEDRRGQKWHGVHKSKWAAMLTAAPAAPAVPAVPFVQCGTVTVHGREVSLEWGDEFFNLPTGEHPVYLAPATPAAQQGAGS